MTSLDGYGASGSSLKETSETSKRQKLASWKLGNIFSGIVSRSIQVLISDVASRKSCVKIRKLPKHKVNH